MHEPFHVICGRARFILVKTPAYSSPPHVRQEPGEFWRDVGEGGYAAGPYQSGYYNGLHHTGHERFGSSGSSIGWIDYRCGIAHNYSIGMRRPRNIGTYTDRLDLTNFLLIIVV